jgi:hypothetical protein
MSEDQSEKRVLFMSALAEASLLVRSIGSGPGFIGEQRRKAWVALAKLSTDFTWNRVCDLHRGEPRARVSGEELNVLRAAAAQERQNILRAAAARQRQEAFELAGRNELRELRELRERVARLETLFRTVDPDFHREDLDRLRQDPGRLPDSPDREDCSLA